MKTKLLLVALLFLIRFHLYSQSGQAFQWAKRMGGSGNDFPSTITIDNHKNIINTGYFSGTVDFDPGPGIYNLTGLGMFISKLDSSGNFIWAKKIGDSWTTGVLVTDIYDNIYITGRFSQTVDFDPGTGISNLTSTDSSLDIYIAKFNAAGDLIWAESIGGQSDESSSAITLDSDGHVYLTGLFQDTVDFDPGGATYNLAPYSNQDPNGSDFFILKLDTSGSFIWAKGINYSDFDSPVSMVADSAGNVFITGRYESSGWSGVAETLLMFCKFTTSGDNAWHKILIGSAVGSGYGESIALDQSGNLYVTGSYIGDVDFDNIHLHSNAASSDIFILKSDTTGHIIWVKSIGGIGEESGKSIVADHLNNIYVKGWYNENAAFDFDPGTGVYDLSGSGVNEYLSKFDTAGNFTWVKPIYSFSGDNVFSPGGLTLDPSDNLYASGVYKGSGLTLIYPTILNNAGTGDTYDIYIARLGAITYCNADFILYPDTTQLHTYSITSNSSGLEPLYYVWNWGDSTSDYGPYPSHTYADSGFYNICLTIYDSTGGCSDTYCSSYNLARTGTANSSIVQVNVINPTTGIKVIEKNNAVSIFPNPASSRFTIALGNHKKAEVTITDITGKIIYSTTATTSQLEISTKDFEEGIYIVQIKTEEFVETKKVIIAR
jgi:hypothetical protein